MPFQLITTRNSKLFLHILISAFLISFPFVQRFVNPVFASSDGWLTGWSVMSAILVIVYFVNVYYIVPQTLVIGRYTHYALRITLCCLGAWITFELLSKYVLPEGIVTPETLRPPFPSIEKSGVQPPPPPMGDSVLPQLPRPPLRILPFPMIFHLAIGTTIELIFNWEAQKKEREKIEKEKISAELSFLKFQINPHFLFNTLNNIYVLIEKKSDKAGEAMLMLSMLMRHMLYESSNGKVLLRKEIEYIKNYISVQQLRISPDEDVVVNFRINGNSGSTVIEPLILITFIENAFKHGISYNQKSKIDILLHITDHAITLTVSNTKRKFSKPAEEVASTGIGLANTRKRLEILYPDAHELTIHDLADRFDVTLKLYLY